MKMKGMSTVLEKLLSMLIVFLVFCSCEQDKDIATAKNESLPVRLLLHTAAMTVASNTSATRVSDGVMDASLGGPAVTRASSALTTEEEAKVNSLSYFEFSGTADDSRCVKKGYIPSVTTENIATLQLTSSTGLHKVYVVANLGDVTTNIIEDASGTAGTLLSTFKGSTYPFQSDTLVSTKGLPMIGSVDMVPSIKNGSITLLRLVARINVICNVDVPLGESFVCQSMQINNVSNNGSYVSVANYPGNSLASNFTNYTPLTTNSGVWYIPENRRGNVTNNTGAVKNTLAPAYSTCVDITGIYTHAGIKKEVTYRVFPGGNMVDNFEILANTSYTLYMTIRGYKETDPHVVQLVTDLSQNQSGGLETANSYITPQGGKYYKFNATIMGNGKVTPASSIVSTYSGTQNAPAITPASLSPKNAFVVWETGSKGSVIEDGSVTLGADGYVRFKTANNAINGNAVIAVRGASNNILWSWHIWKVPYNPNSDYDIYNTYWGRPFKIMKYNLGATAISQWDGTATNAGDLGLLYQWGRKDPFLGASGWASSSLQAVYTTSYEYIARNSSTTGIGADATIQYSILNPTHFMVGPSSELTDWLNVNQYTDQRDNLWGNPLAMKGGPPGNSPVDPRNPIGSKSIYDPCPPGWRVPPQDAFTRFALNWASNGSGISTNLNVVNADVTINKGLYFYYTAVNQGPTTYYPACGLRGWDTGALVQVGSTGTYWYSSSYSSGSFNASYIQFTSGNLRILSSTCRGHALSVRCAQE